MNLLAQIIVYHSQSEQNQDEFNQMLFQFIYDHGTIFLALFGVIIIMWLLIRAVNKQKY